MSNKQYFIKIDDQPIEVSEEVYRAYKRPAWTERKRREVRAEHELSFDLMGDAAIASASLLEDAVVNSLALREALAELTADERALVDALFFEGLTEREYAARMGIAQKNINKKKQRVLLTLKNFLTT